MGFLFSRSRNVTTRADRIGDFQINSASYGETVPVVLGTTRLSGNIIQWEDFTAHEHRHTQRTGKGGGSKSTQIDYTYTVAVAIGLCSGPISGIGQVWRDKEKYYYPNENIQLTAYLGTHDQQPWSYTQSKHPDRCLPYSGLAYMAGVVDLGNSGSLPTFNFEVKGKLLDTGDGVDVNPADYIKYIIEQVGVKDVVIDGLDHFRSYCANADLLISSPPDGKAKKAQQIITEIAELCNCYLFWSNDRLKIVPLADKPIGAWSPYNQIVYDLTEDDLLSGTDGRLVEYKRKTSSESYNQATVEFINRANSYEKETVSFDILADVQKNGLKPAPSTQAHYIYTKKRATFLAQQLAMKRLYERNQYTFKLDWAFCRLEPGDLVTLTEASCGLNKQVVIITEVQEATDGELTITAVGKPPAIYSPASIDVHENERPFTDYNAPATAVSDVTFIQPPLEVTTNGRELWLGVSAENGWGGCNLWVSDSNDQYRNIGTIRQTARIGKLVAPMGASDTSCTVRMVNGNLQSGTHVDAERGNTLCYIGGECLSYEGAKLNNDGTITLSGLVRGQYNTVATNHEVGDKLTRLDESLYRQPIKEDDIGKTVYLKPTSFNIFGGMEQDIAEVNPFTYTLKPYYIPEVRNYNLTTTYHALGGKAINYDLVANFEPPNLTTLDTVQAWYREGSADKWQYGGDGRGRIVMSGLDVGKTYTVKLVVKDSYGNTSEGVQLTKTIALKTDTPNAVEGVAVRFSEQAIVTWREVQNADVDFYEVRLTMNPGQDDGLLAKVSSTTASVDLERRKGTIYVYAHNPIKGYSSPSILTYNVTEPPLPNNVQVKSQISGIAVTFGVIPSNSSHANVYVNEQVYQTTANSLYVPLEPNVYEVSVSYVDMFGEGKRTNPIQVAVKETIGKELLDTESLGLDDIDKAIDRLDNQVTNLDGSINSRISTATSSIQSDLDATKGKVSNLQNQYDTTARWAQQAHQRINTALDGVNAIDNKIATAKAEVVQNNKNYVDTQVNSINSNVNSRITQLNSQITSSVDNKVNGLSTRITQLDNAIGTKVANATSGLSSKVTQLENSVNTTITNKLQGLETKVNATVNGIQSTVAEYKKSSDSTLDYAKAVMAMSRSPQLMADPTFVQASNNQHFEIARYSRLGTEGQDVAFKYARPNKNITADTNGMPFGCQTVQGKITDIGYGGFVVRPNGQPLVGDRAKTYIIRIVAQVDDDCTIELNNNEISGGTRGWITSNQGTGKYEEYIGYWTYGNGTANPDSIGYVYVKPKDGKGRGAGRWFIWVTTVEVYESNAYDNSIATVKSSITQLSNSIDMKVANATNGLSSRITQLDNAIKAQVIDGGKVMSALTLYNGGARIDGKLLHVTGKSLFDDNIVTNKMIQANAVTADKLSVGSLSAISATIGTLRTKTSGARIEIKDNLIEVYDDNNRLRVRMGVW